MDAEAIAMTELEEKLILDRDETACREVIAKLEEYAFSIKKQMDAGLSPGEFATAKSVMEAVEAGLKVLRAICGRQ